MKDYLVRKNKTIFHLILILFIGIGIFVPVFNASAQTLGIGSITASATLNLIANILLAIVSILGKFLSLLATGIIWALHLNIASDAPVIQETWAIIRNFSNMFFIVFLILMAFATILDVGSTFGIPGYDIGALLTKFLVAALLINFSLVIGQWIITTTNIVNNTFLSGLGDLGSILVDNLQPQTLLGVQSVTDQSGASPTYKPTWGECWRRGIMMTEDCLGGYVGAVNGATFNFEPAPAQGSEGAIIGDIVQKFFTIIFYGIIVFSLLVPFLIAIIRIPVLWFFLILSPLAWLTRVLPATRHINDWWWKQFWGWNLFMPLYLFFLYIGMSILRTQNQIFPLLMSNFGTNPAGPGGLPGALTTPVQMIFFYVFTAMVLIGGTTLAIKSSFIAGSGVVGAAKWARGTVSRATGITAAGRAAQQRIKQTQEEGINGAGRLGRFFYGGQRGLDEQTARFGSRIGVRGGDIAAQKPFVDVVGKEYSSLERQFDLGQINSDGIQAGIRTYQANDPKGLAYRKMAAKRGMLNADTISSTIQQLQSNPLALEDFAKTAEGAKYANASGKDLLQMASGAVGSNTNPVTNATTPYNYSTLRTGASTPIRRSMFKQAAEDKKAASDWTMETLAEALDLEGGVKTSGSKAILENLGKSRPDLIYDLATTPVQPYAGKYTDLIRPGTTRASLFRTAVLKADAEALAAMPGEFWHGPKGGSTPDPDFVAALTERKQNLVKNSRALNELKQKIRENLVGRPDEASCNAILNTVF